MSLDKKDFYGKEVAAAIQNACDELGVPQEKLEIEVIEAGTTGIFGLIRKKAHIRVLVKPDIEEIVADVFEVDSLLKSDSGEENGADSTDISRDVIDEADQDSSEDEDDDEDDDQTDKDTVGEASPEGLEIIRKELLTLVELMGFPSTLDIESVGHSVTCTLRGEFEENLTGADGKVLDSLQYLLRKIISRKVPERLRISINVGDFRERRLEDLKVRAVDMAAQVKEDGKTQVLPALNPAERRVIHMILQEDKEIRSRSVGDGLFKKILIYKPGKGNRSNGRKRNQSKGRQNKSGPSKKESDS